jgi:hypothetical protein
MTCRRRGILPYTSQAQVALFLKMSLLEPSRASSLSSQSKAPTKAMRLCDRPLRLFHDDAISFLRLAHHLVCLRSSPLAFQSENNAIASPDFDIVILNQTFSAHYGFTIVSANEFVELDTPPSSATLHRRYLRLRSVAERQTTGNLQVGNLSGFRATASSVPVPRISYGDN